MLGGIGFFEIAIIAVVVLVIFGPQKLPELMRQAGKFFVQTRRMTSEVKSTFDDMIHDAEKAAHKEKQEVMMAMLNESKKEGDDSNDLNSRKHEALPGSYAIDTHGTQEPALHSNLDPKSQWDFANKEFIEKDTTEKSLPNKNEGSS